MGFFDDIDNSKIFDDLENGIKDISNKIKTSIENSKNNNNKTNKCPNCGASLSKDENNNYTKCEYCGTKIKNSSFLSNLFDN